MKTKNNVQKTTFRFAAFFIFFTVSLSQVTGTEKQTKNIDNSTNGIEETVVDEKLNVESWMTDAGYFASKSILEIASDKPIAIETWMTNDALFTSASSAITPVAEPGLELESWMLNENNFNPGLTPEEKPSGQKKVEIWKVQNEKYGNRKFILTQVTDKKMEIERWMIDDNFWQ